MSIIFSNRSKHYIEKNNISNFLIDVQFIKKSCAQICYPYVTELINNDIDKYKDFEKVIEKEYTFYISNQFNDVYGKLDEYHLDIGGFFKKILNINNIDPIIKNTCKIE